MRMAEVKAAPPLSAASENPPSNEVTQNSKPKSSGGGGGSGRRRGGDRGGGNGSSHGGNGSGHGQTGNSYDNDRADSVGRSTSRKKPELEHYKPGAFHGSRTPNNELNDQTPQQDETPQHSSGNKHSKVKMCTVIKKSLYPAMFCLASIIYIKRDLACPFELKEDCISILYFCSFCSFCNFCKRVGGHLTKTFC